MNYKNILVGVFGVIIMTNYLIPVLVFAQAIPTEITTPAEISAPEETRIPAERRAPTERRNLIERNIPANRNVPAGRNFCVRIDEVVSRIDQQITKRTTKLQTRRQEGINKLTERRNARNERALENQVKRDENRAEHYAKLEARAVTDAQREAVTAFRATVESAIIARKAAIDSATQSFRQSLNQVIIARQSAIDAAVNTFQSSRATAVNQARADCAAGIDARTVRETFHTNIRTAQAQFNNERQGIEMRKDLIEPIQGTQRQAIEKAIADFRATMEKARTDLQASFQQ